MTSCTHKGEALMKFTLMLISLLVADVPMCAQAQAPQTTQEPQAPKPPQAPKAPKAKAAKSSKETTKETTKVAAAQKVVKTISADKVKTQTYCDIGKLGDQIQEADKKGDMKKIDEPPRTCIRSGYACIEEVASEARYCPDISVLLRLRTGSVRAECERRATSRACAHFETHALSGQFETDSCASGASQGALVSSCCREVRSS